MTCHIRWHVWQAPIPNGIGDHLTRPAAQGNPNPGVVSFFEHKRPECIQFQDKGAREAA